MTDVEKQHEDLEENAADAGAWLFSTEDVDDQILRHSIDRLLVSDAFRERTAKQPQARLKDIISQLFWEAGIEVDVVRLEAGPHKGEQILVWRSAHGGSLETHSFTRGRPR